MKEKKERESWVGRKINKLTLIKRYKDKKPNNKKIKTYWECLCDCGKIAQVQENHLASEKAKSCGCVSKLRGKDHRHWKGYGEISLSDWNRLILRLKRPNATSKKISNMEFNITIEYIWDLFLKQDRKCALSGIELRFGKYLRESRNERNASLDRIDSSKGYVQGNVQWVHKTINIMKQRLSDKEFVDYCIIVAKHNEKNIVYQG